jgi:glycosyl-4,4'-diaponeurosporenoate acyltransferase
LSTVLMMAALYALIWLAFHFGAGYVAHRLPLERLASLPVVSRNWDWEHDGRVYEDLGMRAWKDRLPEAGAFYSGGFSKRRLSARDAAYLSRFALETSRAEWSHWLTWALALTFFAWNPWQVGIVMLIYGAIVNLPCILIQRYNRARLQRVARTLARRAHRDGAALPAHAVVHQGAIEGSH